MRHDPENIRLIKNGITDAKKIADEIGCDMRDVILISTYDILLKMYEELKRID